jgi:arylsulfatase A-like enzyme
MGRSMDKPAAALLKDLKQRGLLDDTIVIWTTEFGRMPCSQGGKGRDHNPFTFTSWMAGGGIKGGIGYGESDEWSYKAVKDVTYCYDQHATVLHLLGIDHEKLTFRHNGIDRRLTDVHGHVIKEVLA